MRFWKVFFTGKKETPTLQESSGTYTVSANSCDSAQENGAMLAFYDGYDSVVVNDCQPLEEHPYTAETGGYTTYSSTTSTCAPANAQVCATTTDTNNNSYSSYGATLIVENNTNEYDSDYTEEDYDGDEYTSYVSGQANNHETSSYRPYNSSRDDGTVSVDRPNVYQEPLSNGYYRYKFVKRINLTKEQSEKVFKLVSEDL